MDLLLRVVESRRYVGSLENQKGRLHFVDLGHIMTELPDHMLSRLQRLEADGLEIRLAVPG
ncbi:hypothetical protein K435DRAFT_780473 [Dendrothele bispora CBS 962.96]|uniref:Uncharacterized protein n=1 Tax=Dendrothele bispora (strain CBS 962.96) TaxID=1314807 RepID=A0A4S8LR68_DENBC|nr:hypothetical protein K435DRAFT_780473 [Dendrothele bispora CBS 962.96]